MAEKYTACIEVRHYTAGAQTNRPRDWDRAHGSQEGYFWCDLNGGESGQAWAWSGAYKTEAEAELAAQTLTQATGEAGGGE